MLSQPMNPLLRRAIIALIVGIGIFLALSLYADIDNLGERLAHFGWWAFALALFLSAANYGLRFFRWQLYLRRQRVDVPESTSLLVFLSGFALSVTPGKVGELIKSFLLRAAVSVPITKSAPIVVAERITDLVSLLVLALLGTAIYGVLNQTLMIGVGVGAALVVAALGLAAWPAGMRYVIILICCGPLLRIRDRILQLYGGLSNLLAIRALSWATPLGLVAWLAECLGFALIVSAFPGAELSLGVAMLIYASATVAGALSFLPAGLVVTEAGMTLLLVQLLPGLDQPTAIAATIITRLATLWFAVLLGLISLAILRHRIPQTKQVY